jgi:translocation and assembly module TamA
VFPAHNLQGYWLNGPALASAQSAPLALGCSDDPCFITVSYLEETVIWDRRDDPLEPRRGYYLGLGLQQGGGPLLGDFAYFRFLPEARGYLTPDEEGRLTLAGKLRVGTLLPTSGDPNDSAVVTRFYGGGGVSMRGFNNRRLSPLLLAPAPDSPGTDPVLLTMPVGGNGLIEGSAEVRYQIGQKVIVAAFLDFGTVTHGALPPGDFSRMLYAVGFGIRYLSPVGPIRLDLARRLQVGTPPPLFGPDGQRVSYSNGMPFVPGVTPPDRDFVNDSCFGLGGSGRMTVVNDNLCVLHISIGEAF